MSLPGWLVALQVVTATSAPSRAEVAFVGEVGPGQLALSVVLEGLESRYPPLLAAARKVAAAKGELMSARGAFDLKVEAKGDYDPTGFYDAAKADLQLEQQTPLWGLKVFGGYRYGEDHPIYAAKAVTADAGEARVGLVLPLWRGGPIDGARLGIRLAELGIDVASLDVEVKRLEAFAKASEAYFKWVAAGRKLAIDRGMLELALTRRSFVERRVEEGALAPIERVDNERLVLSRKAEVATRVGGLQRAALKLSLFVRGPDGEVTRPEAAIMPKSFPPTPSPTAAARDAAVKRGLVERPEVARLRRASEALRAQLRFHENQRAPSVDLGAMASKDFGDKVSYGPDEAFTSKGELELGLSLSIKWPVEQRKARGKAAAVRAKLEQLELERRFLADAIEVQIRDAHARLVAAHERSRLALETYRLTRRLEDAERRRLELGQTTILVVNLREEATAKAAKTVVDALTEYHAAQATLAVAAGGRPG